MRNNLRIFNFKLSVGRKRRENVPKVATHFSLTIHYAHNLMADLQLCSANRAQSTLLPFDQISSIHNLWTFLPEKVINTKLQIHTYFTKFYILSDPLFEQVSKCKTSVIVTRQDLGRTHHCAKPRDNHMATPTKLAVMSTLIMAYLEPFYIKNTQAFQTERSDKMKNGHHLFIIVNTRCLHKHLPLTCST